MLRLSFVFALLAIGPAGAAGPAWQVGVSCDGAVPEHIVILAHAPGRLAIRIDDLYEHCIAAIPESHRWRGRT